MIRIILIFCFLFSSILAFSQTQRIADILKDKEIKTEYYELAAAGSKVLFLPMEFGKSIFTYSQQDAIKNLKNANIARIDLVYSDYPSNQNFSPLTKKRLESLHKILPELLDKPGIEFRKIRQTIGKTKAVAETLEHGFFIYFRPLPTKSATKKEVEKLKIALSGGDEDTFSDSDKFESDSAGSYFWCWQVTVSFDTSIGYIPKIPDGAIRTISKITLKEAISKEYINKDDEKNYLVWGDSVYLIEDRRDEDCSSDGSYSIYDLADSTVSAVFKRNRWDKATIIADVTGSMYPYTGQLLKWLKLTLTDKGKRHFVFFNDGDNKEDKDKVIGKTGGIYSTFSNMYDEVEKTAIKAMESGSGGDAPENNIEALLESDKLCADCDSIVMIVDNWASIKDLSLLGKSHKPIKVVVCGVLDRINKDYLKLVRNTKGSLHLIEEDIYNLAELKEGETIKIHGRVYRLIKGEFVDTGSSSI